jgi:hypothetical protein
VRRYFPIGIATDDIANQVLRNTNYESLIGPYDKRRLRFNSDIKYIPTTNFWENLSANP